MKEDDFLLERKTFYVVTTRVFDSGRVVSAVTGDARAKAQPKDWIVRKHNHTIYDYCTEHLKGAQAFVREVSKTYKYNSRKEALDTVKRAKALFLTGQATNPPQRTDVAEAFKKRRADAKIRQEKAGISRNLNELLGAQGMSQAELAKAIGVSPTAISGYVCGRRNPPKDTAEKIAEALGVSVEFLLGEPGKSGVTASP
jgi:transcriptional regulator with XRE-family HTH domain